MRSIPVYKAEKEAGLANLIQAKSSVSYLTQAKIDTSPNKNKVLDMEFAKRHAVATNQNQLDLYYLKDILVSTGWNLNTDIFIHDEVWPARNTAEDKQFNLGHNQKEIIGHMTSQYVIGTDGSILADDSDICSLPDKFHIVSTSVIYRYWPDKEYMEKINQIIAEIEESKDDKPKWFVSMECLFSNFDYGVIDSSGAQTIIPRNSASAFLTKHLRAYGGTGEYKDCKIGRVLRNITFSGKGLVEDPANPESLILNENTTPFKAEAVLNNSKILVGVGYTQSSETISKENDSMAIENNVLEKQLEEVKAQLDAEKKAKTELEKKLTDESNKAIQAKVEELNKVAEAAKAKTVEVEAQLKARTEEVTKASNELTEANKKLVEVNDKLAKIEKDNKAIARKSEIVTKLGLDEAGAGKLEATLSVLTDEAFASYIEASPKAVKVDEKKTPTAPDIKVLENVEVQNQVASVTSTNNVVNETRTKISGFLAQAIKGNKTAAPEQEQKS